MAVVQSIERSDVHLAAVNNDLSAHSVIEAEQDCLSGAKISLAESERNPERSILEQLGWNQHKIYTLLC